MEIFFQNQRKLHISVKSVFLSVFFSIPAILISQGGMIIGAGAKVTCQDSIHIVLEQGNWTNNGSFSPATSTIKMVCKDSSKIFIQGDSISYFSHLSLNTNDTLFLGQNVILKNKLVLVNGILGLAGKNLKIDTLGTIVGERETSRVTGVNGGEISHPVFLSGASPINPGNLGLKILNPASWGWAWIYRGHQPQNLPNGPGIQRYFRFLPLNNPLKQTRITLHYFDEELAGSSEQTIEGWKNNGSWNAVYAFQKNFSADSFIFPLQSIVGTWTLAPPLEPLALTRCLIEIQRENNRNVVYWEMAGTENVNGLYLQRSNSLQNWKNISSALVPAHEGKVSDPSDREAKFYYRIKMFLIDGSIEYSNIAESQYPESQPKISFTLNQYRDIIIHLNSLDDKLVASEVFDASARKILEWKWKNRDTKYQINLSELAAGFYFMRCWSINGDMFLLRFVLR